MIKNRYKIDFRKNKIPYSQDHSMFNSIPHQSTWTTVGRLRKQKGEPTRIALEAPGYGAAHWYGNGHIYCYVKDIINDISLIRCIVEEEQLGGVL